MAESSEVPEAWFASSFGDEYLRVYRHRSEQQARREVEFAAGALGLSRGAHVLDLCCGSGRHVTPLVDSGMRVVGLDLSPQLLEAARVRSAQLTLVRADMRFLPFRACFDAVLCFFTSFGYFFQERENVRVLKEIGRVLVPGGTYLLDLMNRSRVIETLVPESERIEGDLTIRERRWISDDQRRVEKEIRVLDGVEERRYFESVRLYERAEVESALDGEGFSVLDVFGNFDGEAYPGVGSSRMIFVGQKRDE